MFKVTLDELRGDEMHRLNDAVTHFQKQFHAIMKSKGYERKTSIASALYEWEYTKGSRKIQIGGWHSTGKPGTNRYWGPVKSFFCLYDSNSGDYMPVVQAENCGNDTVDVLVKQQYVAMDAALEYIRKNA